MNTRVPGRDEVMFTRPVRGISFSWNSKVVGTPATTITSRRWDS